MKKIWMLLLMLSVAGSLLGQDLIPRTAWNRSLDTATAKDNNVKVPVYLQVGRNPGDPFPTYIKSFISMDSVQSDEHYIPISGWLSMPIPTTTLQHVLAGELYYTYEGPDTMKNNLVGQELSVNVPGRLVFNKQTGGYGIYGLIVNSKPTMTQRNGFMSGPRFTGIFIDLADVSGLTDTSYQVDSVRFDTTRGIWVPRLDGGRADSGFYKYAFWAENNIYTRDSLLVGRQLILGAKPDTANWSGSNMAWIGADTIRGIHTWQVTGTDIPVINSRGTPLQTGILRLYADSAQVRLISTSGYVQFQIGDSAFTGPSKLLFAGVNNQDMTEFQARASSYIFKNRDGDYWQLPPKTAAASGYVLTYEVRAGTDSTYWAPPGGGSGTSFIMLDSVNVIRTILDTAYMSNKGDTIPGTGRVFDFNTNYVVGVSYLDASILDSVFYIQAAPGQDLNIGTIDPGDDLVLGMTQGGGQSGAIRFWQGASERFYINTDTINGKNTGWLRAFVKAYLDTVVALKTTSSALYTDSVQGITEGNPYLGDTLNANQNDIEDINKATTDTLNAQYIATDTINASTWMNLEKDTLIVNVTQSAAGTQYNHVNKTMKIRPGTNVSISAEDSTNFWLMRFAVPTDSIGKVINDSLRNASRSYIIHLTNMASWDRPLADSIIVWDNRIIGKDSDTEMVVQLIDSSYKAGATAIQDTIKAYAVMPDSGIVDSFFICYISSASATHYITELAPYQSDRTNNRNAADSLPGGSGAKITTDRDANVWTPLWFNTTDMSVGKNEKIALRIIFYHSGVGSVKISQISAAYRRR